MEEQQQTISAEQALQAQFAKVGQLTFQIDIMQQQIANLEKEKQLLADDLNKKD